MRRVHATIKEPNEKEQELEVASTALNLANETLHDVGSKVNLLKKTHNEIIDQHEIMYQQAKSEFDLWLKDTEGQKNTLIASLELLKSNEAEAKKNILDVQNDLKMISDTKNYAIKQLADLHEEAKKLIQKKNDLEKAIELGQTNLGSLHNSTVNTKTDLDNLSASIKSKTNTLFDLENTIKNKQSELQELTVKIQDAEKIFKDMNNSVWELIKEKGSLSTDIENLKTKQKEIIASCDAREAKAVERERVSTLLVETLDRKVKMIKDKGDVSAIKEFLKENFPV